MRAPRSIAAAALALGLAGSACIGTTPEEEAADRAGPDDGDEGPTHRPGQPCLACHGADYTPGGQVFAVAGTVYLRADDDRGLRGAHVEITDDDGAVLDVVTNETGNFMISVGGGGGQEDGWLRAREAPVFPLTVRVYRGDGEQPMRSVIHREGSCAVCHSRDGVGAVSVGKVFLEREP
ncbi:MAG TPA: hypothetical protein VK698_37780 [Kofleriaceae bacterium]|nr:hypothetical protein [Kofleriaceae bacterium]